jgi:hypothetical protein
MTNEEMIDLVWRIVGGMPVEVFDEDTDEVWENSLWELVNSRPEGDFAGTRAIGSANLVTALNLLHQKMLINSSESATSDHSLEIFNDIMSQLQERKLIRHKPERVRQTFKIVKADQ